MIAAAALVGAALLLEAEDGRHDEPTDPRALTRPIRVRLDQGGGFDEFLTALRVYHYRVKPRGTTLFEDIYYDTDDWKFHEAGYSYRFRTRTAADDTAKYEVQLKRARRLTLTGSKKLEISSDLTDAVGLEVRGGAWQRAVLADGVEASNRLRGLLRELEIDPAKLRPRLRAQMRRERFDVTDKGQIWFELDHETWSGELFDRPAHSLRYDDVVIDTRLKSSHPEILRRVSTMKHFSGLVDGTQLASEPPQESAIAALSQN